MKICLWERRNEQRYSLSQLANISGVSRSTLNNIENGNVSPTLKQLEAIAGALKIGIVDLFESEHKYGSQRNTEKG